MSGRQRTFKRLVLGDVIEIPLAAKQLAYAQYIYYYRKEPVWGALIRVLRGIHSKRPDDLAVLVAGDDQFLTFYPAGAVVRRGVVQIVGQAEIPRRYRTFPLFKGCNTNFNTGKKTWWLWDGKREWCVGDLAPEHYDLPILEIITHQVLVDRIRQKWSARDEV